MDRKLTIALSLSLAFAAFVTLQFWLLSPSRADAQAGAQAQDDPAGAIRRLAANFRGFIPGEGELTTTERPAPGGLGGTEIYRKTVTVPGRANVLYVTISTTGDSHFGRQLLLA